MADTDWIRIAIEAGGWAASSLVGLGVGLWRGGRRSALDEQKIRDEFKACIAALGTEIEDKLDRLASQYDETLKGIRQKVNDVELQTERNFVSKEGFEDFRKEYREDMRALMDKLDRIPGRPRQ